MEYPGAASPSYLVTSASNANVEVVQIIRNGRVTKVVATGRALEDASWSADGSFLAWLADGNRLVAARGDGGAQRVLARLGDCRVLCSFSYDWSPLGHRLVVAGVGGDKRRVVSIDAATGTVRDVTPPGAGTWYRSPRWSPTGRLIAYTQEGGVLGTASCCKLALVVAAPDGRGLRTLVRFDEPIHDSPFVSWAPDGRRLAFTTDGRSTRDPRFAIVDVTTGKLHRLSPRVANLTYQVVWAPNGHRIAYGTSGMPERVATVGVDGLDLLVLQGEGIPAGWARDGNLTVIRGRQIVEMRDQPQAIGRVVFRLLRDGYVLSVDRR
jgi:Tol biopolymer transport system component